MKDKGRMSSILKAVSRYLIASKNEWSFKSHPGLYIYCLSKISVEVNMHQTTIWVKYFITENYYFLFLFVLHLMQSQMQQQDIDNLTKINCLILWFFYGSIKAITESKARRLGRRFEVWRSHIKSKILIEILSRSAMRKMMIVHLPFFAWINFIMTNIFAAEGIYNNDGKWR